MNRRAYDERGVTLLELLIALAIGLVVVFGVGQIYVGTKQAYRAHEAAARLQEDGRFALEIMSRQLRMAGLRTSPLVRNNDAFPAGQDLLSAPGDNQVAAVGFPVAAVVVGTENGTSDSIAFRFQGAGVRQDSSNVANGAIRDCLFSAVADNETVVSRFYLNTTNNALYCQTEILSKDVKTRNEPLISGVQELKISYGIDGGAGPHAEVLPLSATTYADATGVSDWTHVVSVRIDLSLQSEADNVATDAQGGDRRLRRKFSTTINLRNRAP